MVLLLAVGLGVLAGWALGGRLSRLADLRLRAIWLFYVAIGLQIVAFPSQTLPWSVGDRLAIGALALVLRLPRGRGGLQPAREGRRRSSASGWPRTSSRCSRTAATCPGCLRRSGQAGHTYTGSHNNEVVASHPHLAWLVDRWAVPHWIPGGNVYSVGDVLIAVGAVVMVSAAMGGRVPSRRPAATSAAARDGPRRRPDLDAVAAVQRPQAAPVDVHVGAVQSPCVWHRHEA